VQRDIALLYEATEGGAGVLRRLVEEADALSRIALEALLRMYLEGFDNVDKATVGRRVAVLCSCLFCD